MFLKEKSSDSLWLYCNLRLDPSWQFDLYCFSALFSALAPPLRISPDHNLGLLKYFLSITGPVPARFACGSWGSTFSFTHALAHTSASWRSSRAWISGDDRHDILTDNVNILTRPSRCQWAHHGCHLWEDEGEACLTDCLLQLSLTTHGLL